MPIKNIVRITTNDTKKTYELPSEEDTPNLWRVQLTIQSVDRHGRIDSSGYDYPKGTVFVERETLEGAGVLPKPMDTPVKERPEETVEDLIIRLLEHLGYYPYDGGR